MEIVYMLRSLIIATTILALGGTPLSAAAPKPSATAKSDWPTYNNGYDGQRFAPVDSITPANVGSLKRACEARLGDDGAFHSGLIVIDHTLYVATAHTTVALDSSNCAIR